MIYHQNSQKFHLLPRGVDIDHIILCSAYFLTDHSPGIDFGDSKGDNFVAKIISVKETRSPICPSPLHLCWSMICYKNRGVNSRYEHRKPVVSLSTCII